MNTAKKVIVGAMLLALLAMGALTGLSLPTANGSHLGAVPVALADECDNNPPPPFLDCLNPTPTPTPKP